MATAAAGSASVRHDQPWAVAINRPSGCPSSPGCASRCSPRARRPSRGDLPRAHERSYATRKRLTSRVSPRDHHVRADSRSQRRSDSTAAPPPRRGRALRPCRRRARRRGRVVGDPRAPGRLAGESRRRPRRVVDEQRPRQPRSTRERPAAATPRAPLSPGVWSAIVVTSWVSRVDERHHTVRLGTVLSPQKAGRPARARDGPACARGEVFPEPSGDGS